MKISYFFERNIVTDSGEKKSQYFLSYFDSQIKLYLPSLAYNNFDDRDTSCLL